MPKGRTRGKAKRKRRVKDVVELAVKETEVTGAVIDEPKSKEDYDIDALNLVNLRFKAANNTHEAMQTNWTIWNNNFRSHLVIDEDYAFKSQIFVPITEKIIRAILSKYIVAMFLRRPFFDLKPRGPADKAQVERLKALLIYTFDKMPDFFTNMVRFVQMMLIYGTAFGKVYWRKVYKYIGKDKKKTLVYNGPYFEPLDISNFFIDEAATKLNGFYKVHRSFKTKKALKALGIYKNLDKITAKRDSASSLGVVNTVESDRRAIRDLSEPTQPVKEYDVVELKEYWAEDDSRIIVVANDSVVIRDDENPFWHGEHPFVCATYEPLPFEIYGKGICEKLSPHQSMINTLTNEIIDNVRLMNNKMWIGVINTVNASQIVSKAGKIIWVDDINALKEVTFAPIPTDVHTMIGQLKRDCEEVTASTSLSTAIGAPITKEQTALEVSTLSRLGNEIHALNVMLLEIPAITEIVRKCYALIQQNFNQEQVIRITENEEGWDIATKEDVALDVDVIPKIGMEVLSREVIQQNLIGLLQFLKDMPGYDTQAIIKLYVENLGYHLEDFKQELGTAGIEAPPTAEGGKGPAGSPRGMVGQVGEVPVPASPEVGQVPPNKGV